jgi:hypothetical protein
MELPFEDFWSFIAILNIYGELSSPQLSERRLTTLLVEFQGIPGWPSTAHSPRFSYQNAK